MGLGGGGVPAPGDIGGFPGAALAAKPPAIAVGPVALGIPKGLGDAGFGAVTGAAGVSDGFTEAEFGTEGVADIGIGVGVGVGVGLNPIPDTGAVFIGATADTGGTGEGVDVGIAEGKTGEVEG